jgi:hypothetical protein
VRVESRRGTLPFVDMSGFRLWHHGIPTTHHHG